MTEKEVECSHNWFDDNFKGFTYCDKCGISYNDYIHEKERQELLNQK
jgi:hypothetical protein